MQGSSQTAELAAMRARRAAGKPLPGDDAILARADGEPAGAATVMQPPTVWHMRVKGDGEAKSPKKVRSVTRGDFTEQAGTSAGAANVLQPSDYEAALDRYLNGD